MKRIWTLLLTVFLLAFSSLSFAEEEYPAENYAMYYQSRSYPIFYEHMGYAYILDTYTVRMLNDNPHELLAVVHELDQRDQHIKPNPVHLYAKYNPAQGRFVIGRQQQPNTIPQELYGYDAGSLANGSSKQMLFNAGRTMWECFTREPLYRQQPMLKPVGESGGPPMIYVNDKTRYARLDYDTAEVDMLKPTGIETYRIVFNPANFVIKSVYAENPQIQERLRREEVGVVMYYQDNPRVRLVANYLGFVHRLDKEQLTAVGAY